MLGKLLCEIRLLLKKRSAVRNGAAPETGKFQDESAHDGGVQPSTSSTTPTLISETEAPLLISDKTSADQGPQTTQSTATLVPRMYDSKSGPAKSSDKLRSPSITSKSHRTSGTRLIREMFKQDSKRKRVISPTLENSHGDSTVACPVYPFDACSTKHSNLVSYLFSPNTCPTSRLSTLDCIMYYGFDYCILFVEWTEQLNIMVLTWRLQL